MASYMGFTSLRTTAPDPVALLASIHATVDVNAGLAVPLGGVGSYLVKKATPFSGADVAGCQAAIDAAPALTPQREAQNQIDAWPLALKALVLALIDQLNVIRAALPVPLPPITPGQALAAIRAKAGTL